MRRLEDWTVVGRIDRNEPVGIVPYRVQPWRSGWSGDHGQGQEWTGKRLRRIGELIGLHCREAMAMATATAVFAELDRGRPCYTTAGVVARMGGARAGSVACLRRVEWMVLFRDVEGLMHLGGPGEVERRSSDTGVGGPEEPCIYRRKDGEDGQGRGGPGSKRKRRLGLNGALITSYLMLAQGVLVLRLD